MSVLRNVLVALLTGAAATHASAAVIYTNGAPNQRDAWTSDSDAPSLSIQAGDNFSLSASATLRHIDWWGTYFGGDRIAPAADNFTVRLFAFVSGQPATSAFYEFNIGDTTRTLTGNTYPSGLGGSGPRLPEYMYSADIAAVPLLGGTEYLLSIVNNTAGDTDLWGWGSTSFIDSGYNRDFHPVFAPNSEWGLRITDLAFVLSDSMPISEPNSLLLLSLVVAGLGLSRRKLFLS